MTSYYNERDKWKAMGVDYDLLACLEYNTPGLHESEIKQVLAVVEGERDAENWHWIIATNSDQPERMFCYLTGGCDYTGWDCQSWAKAYFGSSVWHVLDQIASDDLRADLRKQVVTAKSETWRELMDAKLNETLTKTERRVQVNTGDGFVNVGEPSDDGRVLLITAASNMGGERKVRIVEIETSTTIKSVTDEESLLKMVLGQGD